MRGKALQKHNTRSIVHELLKSCFKYFSLRITLANQSSEFESRLLVLLYLLLQISAERDSKYHHNQHNHHECHNYQMKK
jgi:hypothetical protein